MQLKEGSPVKFIIPSGRHSGLKLGKITDIRFGRGISKYTVSVVSSNSNPEVWTLKGSDKLQEPTLEELKVIDGSEQSCKTHLQEIQESRAKAEERRRNSACDSFDIWKIFFDKGYIHPFADPYSSPTNIKARIEFSEGIFDRKIKTVTKSGVVIEGRKKALPWRIVKEFIFEERKLPTQLSQERKTQLDNNGFTIIGFGSEFIEHSYAIAKTPSRLYERGASYECPGCEVFYDITYNAYWREAGSFD